MRNLSTLLIVLMAAGFSFGAYENLTEYDTDTTALRFLTLAYASYCPEGVVDNWTCYWCTYTDSPAVTVTAYIYQDPDHIVGYVGYASDAIIVSFRGTEPSDLHNWIVDITNMRHVQWKEFNNSGVGSGWYEAYMEVQPQLLPAVQNLISQYPYLPLVFVGHSLGGAMTVMAAADVSQNFSVTPDKMIVWTYGEPRVGDAQFANTFDQAIGTMWRVVNIADMVPHVPPPWLGFEHHSHEVWYPNATDREPFFCAPNDPPHVCANSVSPFSYSIADHLSYLGVDKSAASVGGC